jgi:uncharacterized protein (DUF849 family)
MIRELPPDSLWAAAGLGDAQLTMNSVAIAMGGGVRVGLEDNIWYDRARTKLAWNVDLLKRIHLLADANERAVMQPTMFRKLLRLDPGNGAYGRNEERQDTAPNDVTRESQL